MGEYIVKDFKQRQEEYLTKIKNNPDIINKIIIDKDTEEGKRSIEVIFNPKNEKELFVAEAMFSMTTNILDLFEKIRNGEIETIPNNENTGLRLYIEVIDALKNNEKEYAEYLVKSTSPKEIARMLYETIIAFTTDDPYDCIKYIANESGFDCKTEYEIIDFYDYYEQAKELIDKNGNLSKDLEDCTTEDFELVDEVVNEFSRLCKKERHNKIIKV